MHEMEGPRQVSPRSASDCSVARAYGTVPTVSRKTPLRSPVARLSLRLRTSVDCPEVAFRLAVFRSEWP